MNFTNIAKHTSCDCLLSAVENTTDTFVRSVRKSNNLSESDFRNHIERHKTALNPDDCNELCGLHGVSFEIWNDDSAEPLMEKYLATAAISPMFKKNLCVIKFMPNSGVVKHTPNQKEYNEFHYDFYKDDSFVINNLELVKMIPLIVA